MSTEVLDVKSLRKQYEQTSDTYLTTNVIDLFSLKGRVIAITGGAQGIGLALAFACAEAGAKVAVIDARAEPHKDYHILEKQCSKLGMYQYDIGQNSQLTLEC